MAPEYEVCRDIAEQRGLPLREVYRIVESEALRKARRVASLRGRSLLLRILSRPILRQKHEVRHDVLLAASATSLHRDEREPARPSIDMDAFIAERKPHLDRLEPGELDRMTAAAIAHLDPEETKKMMEETRERALKDLRTSAPPNHAE